MVTYKFPYNVFERVNILAINIVGRITCIKISGSDIYYMVEYWWDCNIKIVSLMEDELEKMEKVEPK